MDRGSVAAEYTLLALFIAVAAVVGIAILGGFVLDLFGAGSEMIPPDTE
jgi:Flp pilus assembly pilin Flp